MPAEGKSTVAANLAVTFAFAGATVLLIDGDLRRGQLHSQFEVEKRRRVLGHPGAGTTGEMAGGREADADAGP